MKSDKKDRNDAQSKPDEESIQEIPGMELDSKYSSRKPIIPENTSEVQKELEKVPCIY